MNKVILVGRLTKDVEVRTTQSGKSVGTFTLAVDRRFKQEGQQTADFINCVAWGRQAEVISQYLGKGSQLAITGRIQCSSYEKEGQKRYSTDIIVEEFYFIGNKNNSNSLNDDPDLIPLSDDEDDLPF